ncbi:hypothetical protein FZ103_06935 [Streptomonospora sp. PA3]|uniref:hypothetical protein n=1 Tax=Streptomonospora sp. PA3 TaxID=2607326 RepID=UPI0012DDF27C|nr:hypothetical protein [Streptomonospora sp. PA3]MUL40922.1 hypothetical protein [Streptomonospora sp. PA3]
MTHRRGNGLLAETYVPLIVLPTDLADQMLDALRDSGIAAYAVQLDEGLLDDTAEQPGTDHLYVDARERAAAEAILRDQLPDLEHRGIDSGGAEPAESADSADGARRQPLAEREPGAGGPADDDDVWADLVARFYDSPASTGAEWPDAENLAAGERAAAADSDDPDAADSDPDEAGGDDRGDAGGSPRARVVRPAEPGDDHEHFVPPPPPPLPRGDLTSRLSWAGLFGGPLVLLGSMLLGISLPGWLAFLAVAAFIAGFVVLVVRMGDRPPGDNGPDDGAVV